MNISEALDLVTLAESVDEHILGEDAATWTERLDTHAAQLRPAVDTLLHSGDDIGALRLAGALSRYAQASGQVDQVRDLVDYVLAATSGRQLSDAALARALLVKGELAFRQADQAVAETATQAALVAAQDSGDTRTEARAEMNLARVAFREGHAPRIFEHGQRMLDLAGQDARLTAGAVHMLAWGEYTADNIPAAIARFEENVERYRTMGDLVGVAGELANLGDLAAEVGDLDRAASFLGQALDFAVAADSRYLLPGLLASIAALAGARGRHDETVELAAAAEQQYVLAGLTPDPGGGVSARILAEANAELGQEYAEELAVHGRERTLDESVELARLALA